MSERKFNINGSISIKEAAIISVEKGSVEKAVAIPVCAFSMRVEGSAVPVKVILKGDTAKDIWVNELAKCKSLSTDKNVVLVNIEAELREIRAKEFVIHNPISLDFYKLNSYKVGVNASVTTDKT